MPLQILVIDDLRTAREDVGEVYARTPSEGIELLGSQEWDIVFLDHDLGSNFTEGALTIWPCIEFIEENINLFRNTTFRVISSSPRAANIVQALEVNGLEVERWSHRDVGIRFKTEDWSLTDQ